MGIFSRYLIFIHAEVNKVASEDADCVEKISMNHGKVGRDYVAGNKIGVTVQAQGAIYDISLSQNWHRTSRLNKIM